MRFNLPCSFLDSEMRRVVAKAVRKQKVAVTKANRRHLEQLAEIFRAIAHTRKGMPSYLVRKKLPQGLGEGIFLHPKAEPIQKGRLIAPYSGKVSFVPQNLPENSLYAFEPLSQILLTKEEQSRFDGSCKFHPRRLYSMLVDAQDTGNFTRFINHSDHPNIAAEFFAIPKNSFGIAESPIEVMYVAMKTIRPGEQLLVNYDGDDHSYWDAVDFKPIPITPQTFRLDASLKIYIEKKNAKIL